LADTFFLSFRDNAGTSHNTISEALMTVRGKHPGVPPPQVGHKHHVHHAPKAAEPQDAPATAAATVVPSGFDKQQLANIAKAVANALHAEVPSSLTGNAATTLKNEINTLRALAGADSRAPTGYQLSKFLPQLSQLFAQAPANHCAALTQSTTQAFEGWKSQVTDLTNKADTLRNLGMALLSGSLGSNPAIQQLSAQLLQTANSFTEQLPKIKNFDPSQFLSQVTQNASPEGLAKQLTHKFGGDPLQLLRALGANSSDLASLAKIPEFINASTLHDLAQAGVDVKSLVGKLNPSEISQTVQQLAREGLNNTQIGQTLKDLASGKTLDTALQGIKDLPSSVSPQKIVDNVRAALPENVTVAEGKVKVGGALLDKSGSYGTPGGPLYAEGHIVVGEASLSAEGKVTANLKDLTLSAHAKIDAEVNLVRAEGSANLKLPSWMPGSSLGGELRAWGTAQVGANATGEGTVKVDPLHGTVAGEVNGEAFAGARAAGAVTPTVGPVSATLGGAVQAGIGVNYHVEAGFKDGKLSFQCDIGAALGIGIRIKFGANIDFKKLASMIKDVILHPDKILKAVASKIAGGIKTAATWLKNGVRSAVSWVGNKLVPGVVNFAKNAWDFAGGAAKSVKEVATKAVSAVADAGKSAVNAVAKGIGKVFSW
jgi:hypothetical protein